MLLNALLHLYSAQHVSGTYMPIIRSSRLYLCYYHIWCVMPLLLCYWDEGSFSSRFPHPGRIACCPAPDRRPPATKALHTICGNNTSIVSSSWWWAYKCTKHVEQITSAINHSVASSWFSFLRTKGICSLQFTRNSKMGLSQSGFGDVEEIQVAYHWRILRRIHQTWLPH